MSRYKTIMASATSAEIERLQAQVKRLATAGDRMLIDYRSEGCAVPDCGVCRSSKAAEAEMRAAIVAVKS